MSGSYYYSGLQTKPLNGSAPYNVPSVLTPTSDKAGLLIKVKQEFQYPSAIHLLNLSASLYDQSATIDELGGVDHLHTVSQQRMGKFPQ